MNPITLSDMFNQAHIHINSHPGVKPFISQENPNLKFGILELKVEKIEKTNLPVLFKFDIDISESMSEICSSINSSSSRSKLEYLKQTFKLMLTFLAEQTDSEIYIVVGTFNDYYSQIIPVTRITPENYEELIKIVSSIRTKGSTNIEETLKKSDEFFQSYIQDFPEHLIAYILLTDGNPTTGNTSKSYLNSRVPRNIEVFSIGYGSDHNSELLQGFGEYYFINNYENTGNVYGEIVFTVLYKAIKDIEIQMENGSKIYDSILGVWVPSLRIKQMFSEREMNFAIQTVDKCEATISGTIVKTDTIGVLDIEELPGLINESGNLEVVDLRKFIFRYRTQELMKECLSLSKNNDDDLYYTTRGNTVITEFKDRLQTYFKEIRTFMRENDLMEDIFMKVLCDDIYTAFNTVGSIDNALMHTGSRLRAHAREMSYKPETVDYSYREPTQEYIFGLTRQNSCGPNPDYSQHDYVDEEFADEEENYEQQNDDRAVDTTQLVELHQDDLTRYVSESNTGDELYASQTVSDIVRSLTDS
jgi:hypothetical protein